MHANTTIRSLPKLSDRESQILSLASAGFIDKQIASELNVSANTLRTYWGRIRGKLGESTRSRLVALFVEDKVGATTPSLPDEVNFEGWVMDAKSRMIIASDEINQFHGLELGVAHPALAYMSRTHPEDAEIVRDRIFDVVEGRVDIIHLQFRVVGADSIEVVNATVQSVRNAQGEVAKVYGFRTRAIDCTPGRESKVSVGHWTRNYPDEEITIDQELANIIGRPSPGRVSVDEIRAIVIESDAEEVRSEIDAAVQEGKEKLVSGLRIRLPSGQVAWASITRRIERKDDGSILIHGTLATFV